MTCLTTIQLIHILEAGDDIAPEMAPAICHVIDCDSCRGRLDQLARAQKPLLDESASRLIRESRQGEHGVRHTDMWLATLPHLRVIRLIGHGGMGEVYECQDVELNRRVAVKTLRTGQIKPELLARHRREALLQAGLNHPNIVAVYAFELSPAGFPYFVMEYVDGQTLSDLTRDRPLNARTAVEIMLQVARGVAFSHDHQVLHRDLKPSNIMLKAEATPAGPAPAETTGWVAKITDFGLARLINPGHELTPSGHTIGTPAYLAPECVNKALGPVGVGTDIYALGVILYECLTGRPPFYAETVAESIRMIQDLDPVELRTLNPAISRDLETICMKCLEKTPARRYASAAALADDLQRVLNGFPIQARPLGKIGKAMRWCGRNGRLTAALATSAMLLVALGLGGIWFALVQSSLRRTADEQAAEARRAQGRAVAYSDLARNNFMTSLHQISTIESQLGRLTGEKPTGKGLEQLRRELAGRKAALAEAYLAQSLNKDYLDSIDLDRVFKDAVVMRDMGLKQASVPVFEKLIELASKKAGSGPDFWGAAAIGLKSSTMLAISHDEEGHKAKALNVLRQAWQRWPVGQQGPDLPESLLRDRAILGSMFLNMMDRSRNPAEAAAVQDEVDTLNQRLTQDR